MRQNILLSMKTINTNFLAVRVEVPKSSMMIFLCQDETC